MSTDIRELSSAWNVLNKGPPLSPRQSPENLSRLTLCQGNDITISEILDFVYLTFHLIWTYLFRLHTNYVFGSLISTDFLDQYQWDQMILHSQKMFYG